VIKILILLSIGCHALPAFFNFFINPSYIIDPSKIFEVIKSLPDFLYYSPSYIHVLLIYAFCRINDLSWGTKGSDSADDSKGAEIE
jgi:chitin synthase